LFCCISQPAGQSSGPKADKQEAQMMRRPRVSAHNGQANGTRSKTAIPHRIVIVGGGIAGLEIASKLPRTAGQIPIAVTLIDRELAYVWKPMLHTIAAGTSDVSQQETNYIAQARDRRFVFAPGEFKGIDRQAQMVRLGPLTISGRSILPER